MRNFIFLLFLALGSKTVSQTIYCPQNKEVDALIDKAIKLSQSGDSKTTIVTLQKCIAISKSAGCPEGELSCNKNLMLQYAQIYEYKKSLEISKEVEKLATGLKDYVNLATVYKTRATLYDALGLYNESIKQYKIAVTYAELIEDPDKRFYQLGSIYYNLAPYYQDTSLEKSIEYLKKSKIEIEKVKDNSNGISLERKKNMLVSINTNLGTFYYKADNPSLNFQLAESYLSDALKDTDNSDQIHTDTKIDLFLALLELYNKKNEYSKAITYGEKMLDIEKSYSMPYNRRECYMLLAKSYLGTGQNETSQKYLDIYSKLNDSINSIEKQAVEEPVQQIVKKNEKSYSQKLRITVGAAGILTLLFILAGYLIWNYKRKKLYKRYEDAINSLKSNVSESQEPIESEGLEAVSLKPVNIADGTIASLLHKLERFERSKKFIRQDVNFAYLINYVGTNSKYLNEILKQHKGKTFSQYINDLRIDHIMKLLYEEPKYRTYKISYLAEVSGFSSREVFAIAFKRKTGISPSYFIENIQKEKGFPELKA